MSDDPNAAAVDAGGASPAAPPPPPAGGNGATQPTNPLLGGDNGAGGEGGGEDHPPAPQSWPDDWRERWAGKDDKLLSRLKRFASPDNVFKSYLEIERKVSGGQYQRALPDGASEEEVAAYRKAVGIPESPDGYELAFPEGVEVGESQKAQLAAIAKAAHENHIPPGHVKALLNEYTRLQQEEGQRRYEAAQQAIDEGRIELRTEYGRDFKRNITVADQFVAEYGGDKAKDLMGLDLADGRKLGDHPDFVRLIVNAALATAGDDTLVLHDSIGGGKSIEDQIHEGLALVNTDPRKYDSPEHQARMIKLYEAREAQSRRRGEAA